MDPRHQRRVAIVQNIFALSFHNPETKIKEHDTYFDVAKKILTFKDEFFETIAKHAPKYPVKDLAKIDTSILLLALFELFKDDNKQPYKVIINEAIEIAKELGNEKSPAFINAVLGAILDEKNLK
jgi:N utilization substance protein B